MSTDAIKDAEQRDMLHKFTGSLVSGSKIPENHQLAAKIKDGVLDGHKALQVLVSTMVNKAGRMNRGCTKRVTSHKGVDEDTYMEMGFHLGNTSRAGKDAMFKLFGWNPRAATKTSLRVDYLPQPFCAISFPEQLENNVETAVSLCDVLGSRAWMYHPT